MSGLIERFLGEHCPVCRVDKQSGGDSFYAIFRILAGLLFMSHGAQKLFGVLGGVGGNGETVELVSLLGLAGVIEFFGGLLIAAGIFTRLTALISTVEMIIAYFIVHFPQGFHPIVNKGELALLYFIIFLLITKHGSNKWSIERKLSGKEIF